MKTVYKHWGKEEWIELNDSYCYKRIYINKGTRTSFQYHTKKLETNYIISGDAEVWLENDNGIVEKTVKTAGDFFTVIPPRKHRVIALTDLVMQEVSTPEVDDVIRIQDDMNRSDGKIDSEHKRPAICILTAGKGSRLKDLSKHMNKALIPVNNKAAISHIIDKSPSDYDVIVATGYKKSQVEEYCKHMHPERNFKFVNVESYDPNTTGPATSLRECKKYLQRPFIMVASDIYINQKELGVCDSNWLSSCETELPEIYATLKINGEKVTDIKDKTSDGYGLAWTGVMSIFDYEIFWQSFNDHDREVPEVIARSMSSMTYKHRNIDWYDLGTYDSYVTAKKLLEIESKFVIPRSNYEKFYKRNKKVCKFFPDSKKIEKMKERLINFKDLNLLPVINMNNSLFFSYDWEEGCDLYEIDNFSVYSQALLEMSSKLWNKKTSTDDCKDIAINFYKNLSLERIDNFFQYNDLRKVYADKIKINDSSLDNLKSQLDKVFSYKEIFECEQVYDYHGDFHFANIVFNEHTSEYKLLDLRPDFNNDKGWGDMYYDLGKLYAGCEVQFSKIKNFDKTVFSKILIEKSTGKYILNEHKSIELIKFKKFFDNWIKINKLDLKRVKLIAGLVLCKIACLHEESQGNFLFLNGRRVLDEAIKI